jgi:predicted signal transduction protein with EAL and GGDEF domain
VNDTLGLAAGDQLLNSVAERLRACLGPGDTAGRLGGDEFVVLVEAANEEQALRLAQRVEDSLRVPFSLDAGEVSIRCSIGIAIAERGLLVAEELIREADAALYSAKHRGKAQHALFDAEMHETVLGRYSLLADLDSAIKGAQLVLRYQPIFSLAGGEIAGVEALVRWQHPQHGLLGPDRFIPLAEESNLILSLDAWVLKEACRQMKAWTDGAGEPDGLYVSVNLSRAHLRQASFPGTILALLDEVGLEPSRLVLEITEGALVRDMDSALQKLEPLRRRGVRIAIDDFGIGFSSLSTLNQSPVDILKLAKQFVDRVTDGERGTALVRAITTLGSALSLHMVAEGIEAADQVEILRGLGCESGQGFYMARPLDADSVEALLVTRRLRQRPLVRIAG